MIKSSADPCECYVDQDYELVLMTALEHGILIPLKIEKVIEKLKTSLIFQSNFKLLL